VLHSVVVTVNVGDSRAYLFEKGRLRQLTVDHTLKGSFFFPHTRRDRGLSHVLVQAIGPQPVIRPHIAMTTMADGDLLLLCSDGLTSVVSDAEIERIVGAERFEDIPDALRSAIVQKNGEDDFSIIVARLSL
jgi:protein phosphatase